MENINDWEERNKLLLKKMSEWRDSYTCQYNCWEWKEWKFCKHLKKERARIFNKEIEFVMSSLISINLKVVSEPSQSSKSSLLLEKDISCFLDNPQIHSSL